VASILLMMCVASLAEHHEEHRHAHPKYEFKYGVKDPHTHDNKEQAEKRDGHKVEGHYMLVEPDGTIRTVHYNADKHTGFHAHVASILLMMCVASFAEYHEEHHHAHPKYEFKYGVKDPHTHDIKEQAEKRDGHKVEGHYMLVEPDGTIRTVHYNADKHIGFHAHVHKTGHAVHPIHHEKKVEIHKSEEGSSHHKASSYSSLHLH
ncbi:hypothetical protein ANN_14730, partial [Periplaneta americana]